MLKNQMVFDRQTILNHYFCLSLKNKKVFKTPCYLIFNMEQKKGDNQENMLREGNISLILDSYDDLFSDFDPRHYSEKALSEDFLAECRRAVRDKEVAGFELRILVPKIKRKINDEAVIKKRLKAHFQKHSIEKKQELKKIRKEGFFWFVLGVVFVSIATFVYDYKTIYTNLLLVILEPAGWFTMWTGLDKMFSGVKEKMPELDFYRKMSNAKILFHSY